jgi:hypothetical protein
MNFPTLFEGGDWGKGVADDKTETICFQTIRAIVAFSVTCRCEELTAAISPHKDSSGVRVYYNSNGVEACELTMFSHLMRRLCGSLPVHMGSCVCTTYTYTMSLNHYARHVRYKKLLPTCPHGENIKSKARFRDKDEPTHPFRTTFRLPG